MPRSSVGAGPNSCSISSASASPRSPSSPRASSRRTISAVARTPTSPWMSASSSRSQASSSPASNVPASDLGSQRAATLRERVAEPPEEPRALGLVGRGRLVTEELCPGARHGCNATREPSRGSAQWRRRGRARAAAVARHDLRDPVASHRDAVEHVGGLHRALLVGDHDELRPVGVSAQELDES